MLRNLMAGMAMTVMGAFPAAAQDWSGQVTPYAWGAGLGGDITPFSGAPTLTFENSLSEVLEHLDAAFFLSSYARRDRLVIMGDLSFSSSSADGLAPPGIPASGKLTQSSMTFLAGHRTVSNKDVTLDLLAGARAWRIKGSAAAPLLGIDASFSRNFVDPIFAARANIAVAPRWSAILYADIGGFGVGSERTSQILATVNYQFNDSLWISAGYRQLSVDHRSGGTEVDMVMAGPLLGATWRF